METYTRTVHPDGAVTVTHHSDILRDLDVRYSSEEVADLLEPIPFSLRFGGLDRPVAPVTASLSEMEWRPAVLRSTEEWVASMGLDHETLWRVLWLRYGVMSAASFEASGHIVRTRTGVVIAPNGDEDAEARRDPATDAAVQCMVEWLHGYRTVALCDICEMLPLVDAWLGNSLDLYPDDSEGVWRAYLERIMDDPCTHSEWGMGFALNAVED